MTMNLSDYLYDAETKIISTWDIVITPFLSMQFAKARRAETAEASTQSGSTQELRVVAFGWPEGLFVVSGINALADVLTDEQEYYIISSVHELHANVWNLPYPLGQATDGLVVRDAYDQDDLWQAMNRGALANWSMAERFRMSLNQVKPIRHVRDTLLELGEALPNTWTEALKLCAQLAPERLTRDLVDQVNQLS